MIWVLPGLVSKEEELLGRMKVRFLMGNRIKPFEYAMRDPLDLLGIRTFPIEVKLGKRINAYVPL
jgi:hypothetical protein